MAARERKSAVNKQLNKEVQADKEKTPVKPKIRRSRKSASSLPNDNKTNSEHKSPVVSRKRRKKENAADGRSTPRGRRLPLEAVAAAAAAAAVTVEEDTGEAAKTPPLSGQKARKAFLEKELEDILENATGRNTPSMSRRKLIEDENADGEKLLRTRKAVSDSLEVLEEKGGFFLPKPRKGNEKDIDDDNLSLRSFSTFLRTRKNFDKELDDDVLSVRSMSVRSRKGDLNEDDTMSVRSLPRPKKVIKVVRRRNVPANPAGKKKVLLKKPRASPKKAGDAKGKGLPRKKPQPKAIGNKDSANGKEKKKVIRKQPLNIQTKKKAQRQLRSALLIKKRRSRKPKNAEDKNQSGKQSQKAAVVSPKEETSGTEKADATVDHVKNETERLKIDPTAVNSEVPEPVKEAPKEEAKEVKDVKVVKVVKKRGKAVSGVEGGAKVNQKAKQPRRRPNPVGMTGGQKRRRESNIHFEITPSPDDSEVIIVQPRLGPRVPNRRTKKKLETPETATATVKPPAKRRKKKDATTSMLPVGNNNSSTITTTTTSSNITPLPATMPNYSTISTPYILPNYNLLGNNQPIVRNFNANNATVNPNFDPAKPVGQSNLPYLDEPNNSSYGPKVTTGEFLITQTGIMLSGGRIVPSPSNPTVRFPSSSPGFVPDNGVMYPSPKPLESPQLIYQNSTSNVIQPQSCPTTNTAILIKKPESMSTSLISTTAGTIVISPTINNLSDINLLKPQTGFTAATQTDTIMSEKALEGDSQTAENISLLNRYRNVPRMENLPTIPVAKSVNDLLLLKSKSEMQMATEINKTKAPEEEVVKDPVKENPETTKNPETEIEVEPEAEADKKKPNERRKRRVIRNVRINQGSGSELTFSEPESCVNEADGMDRLYKTVSCEQLLNPHKPSGFINIDPQVVYEFGSEPIIMSDALAPFETASSFSLPKKEIMENKIDIEKFNSKESVISSPKAKEAAEVCNFSKENEEALKELGLDSDMDQTKSEGDVDSPRVGSGKPEDVDPASKKAKMKEEVDNVLREMPVRRIPNLYRRTDIIGSSQNRLEVKNPLVVKNNDYLSKTPVKAPTVIDKLLEKNKSLKKAEQEGKFQNSVRNLSENFDNFEEKPIKRNQREMRSRKFTKNAESRRVASKKFANDTPGCKIFERRGSNPEIYSDNYQVANENLPLRRVTDPGDKFQRRGSIDYDSIQKVIDRRCSLPEDGADNVNKIPKNAENVYKVKTESIKTIVVGSGTSNAAAKSRGADGKPRIINIVTSDDGSKKGQNLIDEIGIDALENCFVNGDKQGRRMSVDSCNSETENIKKLMDGLSDINNRDGKLSKEVPYCEGRSSRKLKGSDRRKDEQKSAIADESPEDLASKETILSALGLQSLKAAAQNAQKKKDNQLVIQSDSAGYTGTLKTVIKIQRQEKKGSSKAPLKMIYKASSSSNSTTSAVVEETNSFEPEIKITTEEDGDESASEEGKNGNGKAKSLVIPEKASSFSIHPGRMCSDVCTYCFGKFGLLDTPCHIAQLKDTDKKNNILAAEVHLTADSCLCDACFRHVDKKSNCPTFTEKPAKRKYPTKKQICCVQNCNADSQHSVRRKSFLKLKKSIGKKILLDPAKLEKLQPVHLVTLCNRHIYWIDYFMSCGICKKRLTSVNMYRVGPDVNELNVALSADGIPTILTEKRFLCKICHCYASIRIKCKDPSEMSSNQCQFYENYRKRILQCHGIDVPDSEAEENENGHDSTKTTKFKSKKAPKPTATITNELSKFDKSDNEVEASAEEYNKTFDKEKDSDVKEVTHMNIPPKTNGNLDFGGVSIAPTTTEVNPTQIHVKLGNLNIGALGNLNIGQDVRHGTRPGDMQCFPTETELALRAHFDLTPSAEDQSVKVPRKGFDKCTTTIQFNAETKNLFYNLQMPYGNHSSFFRHLILLEKYFRSGDLVIGRNADPKAVSYISSVQNRIRSYEGIHNPPAPPPPPPPAPVKKSVEIPPSLSIVPQPVKSESRAHESNKPSVIPSRPFTLTPMPSTAASTSFSKTSPLSQIQATVQNIPSPGNQNLNQGIMGSFLKSVNQSAKPTTSHPKPEISITSVPNDAPSPRAVSKPSGAGSAPPNPPYLTTKLQENLKKLATKMQNSKPSNQARAVILNRTIGGQKQSLVQVTTGGKTIHLTLTQFRRIQQMQIRKKQYLEHQAKLTKQKEEPSKSMPKSPSDDEDYVDIKHLSPELEIQEVKQNKPNGNEIFPIISDVRTLSGDDSSWDKKSDSNDGQSNDSFPKIPKTLSVSVTKIPPPDYSLKEQSVDPVE